MNPISAVKAFAAIADVISHPELTRTPAIVLHGITAFGKPALARGIASMLGLDFIDVRLSQLEPDDFCNASFLPKNDGSKGILFLDEMTLADIDVQQIACSLVSRQPTAKYTMPDNWHVIVNVIDQASFKTMFPALAGQLMYIKVI